MAERGFEARTQIGRCRSEGPPGPMSKLRSANCSIGCKQPGAEVDIVRGVLPWCVIPKTLGGGGAAGQQIE